MRSKNVYFITYTGVILAIALLFQSLRMFFPALAAIGFGSFNLAQMLTGTLVNMCLLIAVWNVGIWSGIAISVFTPVAAMLLGQLPIPHMVLVIAIGNTIYVLIAWVPGATNFMRLLLVGFASLAKFGALALMVLYLVIPVLLPVAVDNADKISAMTKSLSAMFVWPQLVTAIIGGLLAYAISPRIPRVSR